MENSKLAQLNQWEMSQAQEELLRCCGSRLWAKKMAELRPFASFDHLLQAAERVWKELSPSDWLEAFSHHPRIGQKGRLQKWAEQEQSGVQGAQKQVLEELEAGNRRYEDQFGHVFLVCATGKSADEMLDLLKKRIGNTPEEELKIAAGEQMKITQIRLEKLLKS